MENFEPVLFVCGIVLIHFSGGFAENKTNLEIPELNWFEAQERCQDFGGISTKTNLTTGEYWIGRYIRLSHWIKIKGCYQDSIILNHTHQVQIKMPIRSVGACQEICNYENASVFAVKLDDCICLKENVEFESSFKYQPSKCQHRCHNKDGIYSGDCGGMEAYNVYIQDSEDIFEGKGNCLSLQCTAQNSIYYQRNCTDPLARICQELKASNVGNAVNWTNSMDICKTWQPKPSYLYGELDLKNATKSCLTLLSGKPNVRWIGVAQQHYTGEDRGWNIDNSERNYFLLCQRCNASTGECLFSSCDDKIKGFEVCSNKQTTEIFGTESSDLSTPQSTQTEQKTTDSSTTPSVTENETTTVRISSITTSPQITTVSGSISTTRQQNTTLQTNPVAIPKNEEDAVATFIPILLGILLPLIALVALIIYIRRKIATKSSEDKNKIPRKLRGVNSTFTEVNNPSYSVKPSSYEVEDDIILDSESPYNEPEEGDYDHPRNKDSRKKDTDDTYHHTTHVSNGGISTTYDSTTTDQSQRLRNIMINRSKNKTPTELKDENGTYSEVDNLPESAYFVLEKSSSYEFADNTVLDSENPYNETEEGEYDHLRNKNSRKNAIDDTYQHATPVLNSHQKQEVECDYDHMHDTFNLNKNSEYGYNSIDYNIHKENTYDKTE